MPQCSGRSIWKDMSFARTINEFGSSKVDQRNAYLLRVRESITWLCDTFGKTAFTSFLKYRYNMNIIRTEWNLTFINSCAFVIASSCLMLFIIASLRAAMSVCHWMSHLGNIRICKKNTRSGACRRTSREEIGHAKCTNRRVQMPARNGKCHVVKWKTKCTHYVISSFPAMGARESTSQHGQQNSAEDTEVVDYYHILEVSEDATPEEIKVHSFIVINVRAITQHWFYITSVHSAVWHWFIIQIKIIQM